MKASFSVEGPEVFPRRVISRVSNLDASVGLDGLDAPLRKFASRVSIDLDASHGAEGPQRRSTFAQRLSSFVRPSVTTFAYGDVRVRNFTIILDKGSQRIEDDREPDKKFDDVLTNRIHTTRFQWYNAIPLSIWFQFYRIANIYFGFVALLALLFVKGSAIKTFVVVIVMTLQSCKDLYEDFKRGQDDQEENSRDCRIYMNDRDGKEDVHQFLHDNRSSNGVSSGRTPWIPGGKWGDVRLGSVVKVMNGELIPADLLIVASSDPSGTYFLSTKSLDGETNLKQREVPAAVQEYFTHVKGATGIKDLDPVETLQKALLKVHLEPPQENLLSMDCSIELGSAGEGYQRAACVGLENFALRGCDLQNTPWIVGIACYTGHATKIMINSSGTPSKQSDLERYLNQSVKAIVFSIGVLSVVFAVIEKIGELYYGNNCEFNGTGWEKPCGFLEVLVKFMVMLWAVLPVTLYIIFEVLHLIIGRQIDSDMNMLDIETNKFAQTRNSSIIEDLGQVSYVFSDKTGTLTANDMRLKYCFVAGCEYGPFVRDEDLESSFASGIPLVPKAPIGVTTVQKILIDPSKGKQRESLIDFFTMLAICHSVRFDDAFNPNCETVCNMVPTDEDGVPMVDEGVDEYQAESPDELALVQAAKKVGITWMGRERTGAGSISTVDRVIRPDRKTQSTDFEVSHELSFSSDRKRMSVVIAQADGSALVWTKGADSVMQDLMVHLPEEAHEAIQGFAKLGLRTMVFGHRTMSADDYAKFRTRWQQASVHMPTWEGDMQRSAKLEEVYRLAEKGLRFGGIAALEDRLQDQVPETIAKLRASDVHVWVLTGDKVETAVEIARACQLFDGSKTPHFVVEARSPSEAMFKLTNVKNRCNKEGMIHAGLVLDGQTLSHILLDDEAKTALYDLASRTSSCLCCRLSPLQKRKLVELVRQYEPEAITLAIGDGANDVPMIQGAHLGIGIRGKEGGASVQASDFAISQFRFLGNLMFVHGRKTYRRLSTFLGYFLYKSIAIGWPYVIHAFISKFRGELPISPILDAMYAPLTSWSVALMVAFDEDYPDNEVLTSYNIREYYDFGPRRLGWNPLVLVNWVSVASVHGILGWYLILSVMTSSTDDWSKQTRTFWEASLVAFTTILVTVHLKLALLQRWSSPPSRSSFPSTTQYIMRYLGLLAALGELLCYAIYVAMANFMVMRGTLRLSSIMDNPGSKCGDPFAPFCTDCECKENIVADNIIADAFYLKRRGFLYCCIFVLGAHAYDVVTVRISHHMVHRQRLGN